MTRPLPSLAVMALFVVSTLVVLPGEATANGGTTFSDLGSFVNQTNASLSIEHPAFVSQATTYTENGLAVSAIHGNKVHVWDRTDALPGYELLVSGTESVRYRTAEQMYAFGLDVLDEYLDWGSSCPRKDSAWDVRIFAGSQQLDSFHVDPPLGTPTFVGYASDQAFDRVDLVEVHGAGESGDLCENDMFDNVYMATAPPTGGDGGGGDDGSGDDGGGDDGSVPPTPTLLDALNRRYDFYWGPIPLDNTAGPGDEQPQNQTQLDENMSSPDVRPTWYQSAPATFACCVQIDLDTDLRQPNDIEFAFDAAAAIEEYVPGAIGDQLLKKLKKLGNIEANYDGFHYDGPFYTLDGNEAAKSRTAVELDGALFGTAARARTDLAGDIYLDADSGDLVLAGPDEFFVQVEVPFEDFIDFQKEWEKEGKVKLPRKLRWLGFPSHASYGLELELAVRADADLDGMIGAGLETSTLKPTFFAGGIGADIAGAGRVEAVAQAGALRADGSGGATFAAGIKGEAVVRASGALGDGEPILSPYSGVQYRNLRGVAFTLFLGPFLLDFETFEAHLEIHPIPWGFDVTVEVPKSLEVDSDGYALVMGYGDIVATQGQTIRMKLPGQSLALASAADDGGTTNTEEEGFVAGPQHRDLLFEVLGEPGDRTDVFVARPMGWYLPNGTLVVDEWNVTLPDVEIGHDGSALLYVDTLRIQAAIQAATRGGVSYEDARQQANAAIDANGDGRSDLAHGVPFDGRAVTRFELASEGTVSDLRLGVGEPIDLSATVMDREAGQPLRTQEDVVEVWLGDDLLATLDVDDNGTVLGPAFVPDDVSVGTHTLELRYLGSDLHRSAGARLVVQVEDRAPQLVRTEPEAFSVVGPETDRAPRVAIGTAPATDLDASTARFFVGSEGPFVLESAGNDTWEGTFDADPEVYQDGVLSIRYEIADLQGNLAESETVVLFDTGPADIVVDGPANGKRVGSTLNVSWEASEPVYARLVAERTGGCEHVLVADGFDQDGALEVLGLRSGTYLWWLETTDLAGNTVGGPGDAPPRVVRGPSGPPGGACSTGSTTGSGASTPVGEGTD